MKAITRPRPTEEERRNDMKKTTKKGPSKASHKKAVRDLRVKPAKDGTVRGGWGASTPQNQKWLQI